jgi:hypothetical protein
MSARIGAAFRRRLMSKGLASNWFIEPCWRKPSLRPNHADMSRAAFFGLVAIWSGLVCGMLSVVILVRVFG